MKKINKMLIFVFSLCLFLCVICFDASATECTEDYYTYSVSNGEATITGVTSSLPAKVIIPSSLGGYPVTGIGYKAFEYSSDLTYVEIPDTVVIIGYMAFYDCSSLEVVVLGENVKTIDSDAFRFCDKLSSINLPKSLTYIGSMAFSSCSELYDIEIPESVTYIGSSAFYNTGYYKTNSNWTNGIALYLDDCLLDIPDYRYSSGTRVDSPTSYEVEAGTRLIAGGAFNSLIKEITVNADLEQVCCGFTEDQNVYYPSINALFDMSFDNGINCGGVYIDGTLLTSLTVPKGVTEIPEGLFKYYDKLTSVSLSSTVKTIGESAFASTGITALTIPGNVTTVGKSAFSDCAKLTKVTFKNGVKTIERNAFNECDSLVKVTIPPSLEKTGQDAFSYCYKLTKVYISDLSAWLSIDFGYDKYEYYNFSSMANPLCYDADLYLNSKKVTTLVIPNGTKKIKPGAFVGADGINEVIIPEGVTHIGAGAFYFFNDYMKTCSFILPKSLKSIDANAFDYTADVIYYRGTAKQWNNISFGSYHGTSTPAEYSYTADHIHKYASSYTVVTKATLSADGKIKNICTRCSKAVTTKVPKVKTVVLSSSAVVYNGSKQTPTVTVKDSQGTVLVAGTDYKVTYPNGMKKADKYTITVTFKGKYSGSKDLLYEIKLATPTLKFKSATSTSVTLSWSKVSGAAKYKLYRLSGDKWVQQAHTDKTSFTVSGLKAAKLYKFKLMAVDGNGKSDYSAVLTAETPTALTKTTTVKAISQSTAAAVNYLKKQTGSIKTSSLIPGLNRTVTASSYSKNITTCTSMTPQGMTVAGDYMLISAYCNCGLKHCSVIYVLNKSNQKYLTTLILDTSCHVGGIASLGNYIWVCDSSASDSKDKHYLRAYKLSDVKAAEKNAYKRISTYKQREVGTKPSYMCAANGYLYVGTFSQTSKTSTIYYYSVDGTVLSQKGTFKISGVTKIQGISIRGKYMVVTSSYGRDNKSQVYVYKDANGFKTKGAKYSSPIKKLNFPNMLEACYIDKSCTYFLFESGAKLYRSSKNTMPLDKFVGIENSKLKIS